MMSVLMTLLCSGVVGAYAFTVRCRRLERLARRNERLLKALEYTLAWNRRSSEDAIGRGQRDPMTMREGFTRPRCA